MIALESIGVDTAAFQNGEKLYRRGLVSQPIEVENGLRYEVGGTDVQSCLLYTSDAADGGAKRCAPAAKRSSPAST